MMNVSVSDVSVILCAYTEERWNDLVAAVSSLRCQTIPPREIIVVIDHNPKLLERVRQEIPGVTSIKNKEPRGLSGARNSGLALAQGSIIAFQDEDAVANPDWIEQLLCGFATPDVLGVGGAITPMWMSGKPSWFPEEFQWVVGCSYKGLPDKAAPVRNLIGCNMAFRREVFEEVGGFRNGVGRIGKHPIGCEETELCIRALQNWQDGQFMYEPRAQMFHRVPEERARWQYYRARCYAEGLSKAQVSHFVGSKDGLSNERTYTFKTLPQGVARGFVEVFTRFDLKGLVRAGAIVAGLTFTVIGYLNGTVSEKFGSWKLDTVGHAGHLHPPIWKKND